MPKADRGPATVHTSVLIRDVTNQAKKLIKNGVVKGSDRFNELMAEWVLTKIDWNSFTTRPK